MERDTRAVSLSDADRFNYYPATPLAVVSWIFEGTLHLMQGSDLRGNPNLGPPLPRLTIAGPQHKPSASWSPGKVHAASVAFYPEALTQVLGACVRPLVDQVLPLDSVANKNFVAVCESLFSSDGNSKWFQQFEERFAPLWLGPSQLGSAPILRNWIRSLATRTAHSSAGSGIRKFQRQIKRWTGQSYRDLQLYSRVENAFILKFQHHNSDPIDLAGLATEAGFADQSHMGREIRRITGLSPAQFEELLELDESFWFYRLVEGNLNERIGVPTT